MLNLSGERRKPRIVSTVASKDEGIDDVWNAIQDHREWQQEEGLLAARRRKRIAREIKDIVSHRQRLRIDEVASELLEKLVDEVEARTQDPYRAADRLVDALTTAPVRS
jgi:LAO/AO transport system kinase